MALIVSAATGNFSAGATWVGGVVPGVGDEARASTGHTITIDVDTTCDEVSNAGTGIFTLASGVTLTANVTHKSTTTGRNCLQCAGTGFIIGNVTSGSVTSSNAVFNNTTGTLSITGNVTGGLNTEAYGAYNNTTGTIAITGNVTGGSGPAAAGGRNNASGTITITGNVTGGSGSTASGIINFSTGSITVTGNVTGGPATGSVGISLGTGSLTITGNVLGGSNSTANGVSVSSGTATITGNCMGGAVGSGAIVSSIGAINVKRAVGNTYGPGNTSGLASAVGVANSGLGVIEIEELEYGTFGQSPTSGTGIRLKKASSNVAVFNYCDTAGAKTLIDATQNAAMPAATDVRSGLSYAGGAATGTLAVPLPSQVAVGVATDNTVGTAFVTGSDIATAVWSAASRTITEGGITAADVWSAATRTITGGTVDTLTNAPSVPTPSQIASQVRTELSVELGRVDAAVSSRATAANIPTADIAAIKSKTDALPASPAATGDIPTAAQNATAVWSKPANELTVADSIGERAKQQSTVAITGAQLAAALS